MAILKLHDTIKGSVLHGCAVYSFTRDPDGVVLLESHLHAGIYTGPSLDLDGTLPKMQVEHRPSGKGPNHQCSWNIANQEYFRVDVVGKLGDEEGADVQMKDVANVASLVRRDQSLLPRACGWSQHEVTIVRPEGSDNADIPLFLEGSCTHFVEFCYKHAGVPIVNRAVTCHPEHRKRIFPATQIYIFASERFNERVDWHAKLSKYPDCLELLETRQK